MRKTTTILLVSLSVLPTTAAAQDSARSFVHVSAPGITIPAPDTDADYRAQRGRLNLTPEAGRLSRLVGTAPAQGSRSFGNWASRHPVRAGLLIGGAAGALVGLGACKNASEFQLLCAATGAGVGGGAGAGAAIGFVISRR
jgi:hypothetical protein